MHHFNIKSLAFYSVTIGSVLLLFKVVTAYGESNLKAPPPINGRYRLEFSDRLPMCENSDGLILNIQQSGIYVNAFLLPATAKASNSGDAVSKPTLTGRLINQQLTLSGKVLKTTICNNIKDSQTEAIVRPGNNSFNLVNMQIYQLNKTGFRGQMNVSDNSQSIAFTATPQKAQKQKSE